MHHLVALLGVAAVLFLVVTGVDSDVVLARDVRIGDAVFVDAQWVEVLEATYYFAGEEVYMVEFYFVAKGRETSVMFKGDESVRCKRAKDVPVSVV